MAVTIVVPCYNEAARIVPSLQEMHRFLPLFPEPSEILIVDDGSTDQTISVVKEFILNHASAPVPIRLEVLPEHRGKGAAIKHGILCAAFEHILLCDADLATPIHELPRLWAARNEAPIVLGQRRPREVRQFFSEAMFRRIAGKVFVSFARAVLQIEASDINTGFKLLRSDDGKRLARMLTIDGWGYDAELLCLAAIEGIMFVEVQVEWEHKHGSKVRPGRDIWRALAEILRIRRITKNGARGE